MKPKIIFFDIDGTLTTMNNTSISNEVAAALKKLQDDDIKLFIATGRTPYGLPHFENIKFDGYLCFNGGYCFTDDEVLFTSPLDQKDIHTFLENMNEFNEFTMLAGIDDIAVNGYNKKLHKHVSLKNNEYPDMNSTKFNNYLEDHIFQMMIGTDKKYDNELLKNTENLSITRWCDEVADVTSSTTSKSKAISHILDLYNINKEEAMAFGDGGNDIDMLEYVGCGVAMGNASDEVSEVADYITKSVDENGILHALRNFELI